MLAWICANISDMTRTPDSRQLAQIKAALFLVCLLPLARLGWAAYTDDFGPNPVEFIQRWTGTWTFNLLLITLCVTPLRTMTEWHWLIRLRRMLGLFCFFYASLHFLSFIGFDHAFEITEIARDIAKRPFVTVGFAAMLLMTPLAITSTQGWMRRLKRHWGQLHKLVYLVALLGVLHYWWLVKRDLTQPAMFALALALLLGMRLMHWRQNRRTPT